MLELAGSPALGFSSAGLPPQFLYETAQIPAPLGKATFFASKKLACRRRWPRLRLGVHLGEGVP